MEDIVITLIITHPHLFKGQTDVITGDNYAVIHMQGISSILHPDIINLGIHEGAILNRGGARFFVPV